MTATDPDEFVSWRELFSSGYNSALIFICLGVWLHAADSLIVATMLPTMVSEIGGAEYIAWTISLYEIGSIVAAAASALLTIRLGVRLSMTFAAATFAFGCALSAIAPIMEIVLLGRLFQGVGGGGLMAIALVSVTSIFPPRLIARTMAMVSLIWGVSSFLGPLIGAFFVEYATWRLGFWFFTIKAGILSIWLFVGSAAPGKTGQNNEETGFPVRRLMMLTISVILIAYAGVTEDNWTTGFYLVSGLFFFGFFLFMDQKYENNRLLPKECLNIFSTTGGSLLMIIFFAIATIAITAYGPVLVIRIHDASPLTAGYIIACSSIGWAIAAIAVSGLPERHDPKFICVGMFILTLSILGFAYFVPRGPVWVIALCAGLEGVGYGMAWTFILRRTTKFAKGSEKSRIAGAIPTIHRMGYALGAAYVGIIANKFGFLEAGTVEELKPVAATLFYACLPFAAAGLLAMIYLIKPRHSE